MFGTSNNAEGWCTAIHSVVHRLGRHFGFQAWAVKPSKGAAAEGAPCTPATIFLVTDHLNHLLVKNFVRREAAADAPSEKDGEEGQAAAERDAAAFARAVRRLHAATFQGYLDWCSHVDLPPRFKGAQLEALQKQGTPEWEGELEEVALYFLLYTEAANLRHMPEALWLLFWLLRNSRDNYAQITSLAATDPRSAAYAAQSQALLGLAEQRCQLRNAYHDQMLRWREECRAEGGSLEEAHAYARKQVMAAGLYPSTLQPVEVDLLAEMVANGDSGSFLEMVVEPVFSFLAVQVDKMGSAGQEAAHRVTYDDCNESLCTKEVVDQLLGLLGVRREPESGRVVLQADTYASLLNVGKVSLEVCPADPSGAGCETPSSATSASSSSGKKLTPMSSAEGLLGVELGWDAGVAATWWARLFRKTYVERRSVSTIFRTFFRVWAFFVLEFNVAAALLWGWGNWYALCSTCLTHAGLCLLEQAAGAWSQRAPAAGISVLRTHHLEGLLHWALINALLWLAFVAQLSGWTPGFPIWWYTACAYTGLVAAQAILSTRPGHCVSISHSLAAACRRRSDRSACCAWLWGGLARLFTRLGASSARPPPRVYLAPYEMRVSWWTFVANALFWGVVLALKFAFDWWAIMKNLEIPVLGLWSRSILQDTDAHLRIAGVDFKVDDLLLCIARCLPGFLVMFYDTQVFYYLVMTFTGMLQGLVQLNLGSVTSFQEVVLAFHKAPFRWWSVGISKKGAANIQRELDEMRRVQEDDSSCPSCSQDRLNCSTASCGGLSASGASRRHILACESARAIHPSFKEDSKVQSLLSDESVSRWLVFSDVWNAVVEELRSVDLISDAERDNLAFVHILDDIDDTIDIQDGMPLVMLPVFFYGGQISRALEVPGTDGGQRLALAEIRTLLVWLLVQLGMAEKDQADALLAFTPLERPATLEQGSNRAAAFEEVVAFLKGLQAVQAKAHDQPALHARAATVQALRSSLLNLCDCLTKEAQAVEDARPESCDAATDLKHELADLKARLLDPAKWAAISTDYCCLAEVFHEADDSAIKRCVSKVVDHVLKLLETSAVGAQPRSAEAQRVLSFFMSSLNNPTMPTPPSVDEMLSWTALTPHFEEDVVYALNSASVAKQFSLDPTAARGLADLVHENENGVSVMQWLKIAYAHEWDNLMERLRPQLHGLDPRHVAAEDFDVGGPLHHAQAELLLWASYRGQLLSRTVRGMMAYEGALRLLVRLENPKPADVADAAYDALVEDLVRSKFTYVVASQVYAANHGSSMARGRWAARGVDMLLQQHPSLRVAYIDTHCSAEQGSQQYSVLIRGAGTQGPVKNSNNSTKSAGGCPTEELYRIRLPRNRETGHGIVLGEGKPENQNHAIIFCWGEVVQAIDMNQDNYLCEALKMRNLLSEFGAPGGANTSTTPTTPGPTSPTPASCAKATPAGQPASKAGRSADKAGQQAGEGGRPWPDMERSPVCLVGFREYIFSQDSGALAGFAASTEFIFGSMVQRVMAWPGAVRFHYGHPDLWSKLFIMTRGGMSKATRAFHISEDVFAGYNHTLRGGSTKFKEYISVGKGRDMGFDSINSFESKVAGGNGEQVMSRDVHRLATRFDFFRLMAFYHSGPGFYINTALVMLSVFANIWMLLLLALTNSQWVVDPRTGYEVSAITGRESSVAVEQIAQLGMLCIFAYHLSAFAPFSYAMELLMEVGILKTLGIILMQLLQGSVAFHIFRSRTAAYYFVRDVAYGGAKYIPTGRGYALRHNSFVKAYSLYARSHLYFAAELILMLVLLALVGSDNYVATTWSAWLVAVALPWALVWFNPYSFQLERCKADFDAWLAWMGDVRDRETGNTWYSWNKAQLEKARDEGLTHTNPYATAAAGLFSCLPTAILGVAAVTSTQWEDSFWDGDKWVVFGVATAGLWLLLGALWALRAWLLAHCHYRLWRLTRMLLVAGAISLVVCLAVYTPLPVGQAFKNLTIVAFANLSLAVVATQLLLHVGLRSMRAQLLVNHAYRALDYALGYLLFGFLFVLSFLQVFDWVQGALLFSMKFTRTLKRARLLDANFLTNYVDRAAERIGNQVKDETSRRPPAALTSRPSIARVAETLARTTSGRLPLSRANSAAPAPGAPGAAARVLSLRSSAAGGDGEAWATAAGGLEPRTSGLDSPFRQPHQAARVVTFSGDVVHQGGAAHAARVHPPLPLGPPSGGSCGMPSPALSVIRSSRDMGSPFLQSSNSFPMVGPFGGEAAAAAAAAAGAALPPLAPRTSSGLERAFRGSATLDRPHHGSASLEGPFRGSGGNLDRAFHGSGPFRRASVSYDTAFMSLAATPLPEEGE